MESPDAKLDLKKTIHLPRTDFPMKASLAALEPKLLERWAGTDAEPGIYPQIRSARKGRPTYILHDGPPLCQRQHSPRPRLQQTLEGFHRKG